MKHKIVAWNLKRNGLTFDPILEAKMLSEEANEFYTAPSLVERIREFADFEFVLVGTKAKFYAKKYEDHRELAYANEHFKYLMAWARNAKEYMRKVLIEEIGWEKYHPIMSAAIDAVTAANNAKGTEKDENGKVVKGPNYVSPSYVIATILKENGIENQRA